MKRGNQKEPCSPAYLSSVLFPDSLSILSVGKKEKRGQEKNTDVGCVGEKEEEGEEDRTDEKREGRVEDGSYGSLLLLLLLVLGTF